MRPRWRHPVALGALALAVFAIGVALAYVAAARVLKSRIVEVLGPFTQVGAIVLRPGRVEIESLQVRAPAGWPTSETLSAKRVIVVPELGTLFSNRVRLASVTVEDAYLSVSRGPDGHMRVLPRLTDGVPVRARAAAAWRAQARTEPVGPPPPAGTVPPAVRQGGAVTATVGRVLLRRGVLELHDGSIRRPPHVIRLEGVEAELTEVTLPSLSERIGFRLDGAVKPAPDRSGLPDGRLTIDGWVVPATRDSQLHTRARGIDLVALQPYLRRTGADAVRSGLLDLDLASTVEGGRLDASGSLALSALQLESRGTFLGLSQGAVLALLKDRDGRLELPFRLGGRIDDPRFSVNDEIVSRAAAALAARLGGGLDRFARDARGAGRSAVEGATDTLRGWLGR
jgi:hypothetical protein